MVGATAIVALRSADDDAARLATRLHEEESASIRMRLDDYLTRSPSQPDARRNDALIALLRSQAIGSEGRVFLLEETGTMIASSAPDGDPVVESAVAELLMRHTGPSGMSAAATEFRFDHVYDAAALAGNVVDLRDGVSRRQQRPSLDSRDGDA